jgi:low temperature requirement protein LtrA
VDRFPGSPHTSSHRLAIACLALDSSPITDRASGVLTAVEHEHRVTPRELFFDLVFVFAFTQVATLLADDPTFGGIGRGVLVLAALW